MTLKVVTNHPIKELIDAELARFNKAHEEGRLESALIYYETTDNDGRCFRKELNPLEALGVCSVIQDMLIEELKEE